MHGLSLTAGAMSAFIFSNRISIRPAGGHLSRYVQYIGAYLEFIPLFYGLGSYLQVRVRTAGNVETWGINGSDPNRGSSGHRHDMARSVSYWRL